MRTKSGFNSGNLRLRQVPLLSFFLKFKMTKVNLSLSESKPVYVLIEIILAIYHDTFHNLFKIMEKEIYYEYCINIFIQAYTVCQI